MHDHLAPYGQELGYRHFIPQPQRHGGDRADVIGDTLALDPVTARRCAHQGTIFVYQLHGRAVEFGFEDVAHGPTHTLPHTFVESPERRLIPVGSEAQHWGGVLDGGETVEHHAADALGRGIGSRQFREALFELSQLAKQRVVGLIGDLRNVLHVVEVVVVPDLGAKRPEAPLGFGAFHRSAPSSTIATRAAIETPRSSCAAR